jgi:hypothetical protein
MKLSGRRLAVAAVALVAVGAGAAYATIPDGNGVIHGCYTTMLNRGQLRVIDTAKGQACNPGEQALNWSQTGVPGPPGTAGPTSLLDGSDGSLDDDRETLISHTVTAAEAGLTILTATFSAQDEDGATGGRTVGECFLVINGIGILRRFVWHDGGGGGLGDTGSGTIVRRQTLAAGDAVSVSCEAATGDAAEASVIAQLLLQRVDS